MGRGEVGLLQLEAQWSNSGSVIVVIGIGKLQLQNPVGGDWILCRSTLHLKTMFHDVEWTGGTHWS